MKDTSFQFRASYLSWILGQISAMWGVILCLIWGFMVVILQAQHVYAQTQNQDVVAASTEGWHPPLSPPLVGLGLAMVGWLLTQCRGLSTPVPVMVGMALNLLALLLAILAVYL